MPRLFSAIEIPQAISVRLSMLRAPIPNASWIDPVDMHLTLRFVGDVSNEAADEFAGQLAALDIAPFELTVAGLGAFGGQRPHLLYAAIKPSPVLDALQKSHDRAARACGLEPEARGFVPHITLARMRSAKPAPVAEFLQNHGDLAFPPFRVERCVLMSARPGSKKSGSGGGPYAIEEIYPFEDVAGEDLDYKDVADKDVAG
jgi:RNA 2',3'-cyclic 3'-phosphodiesterase